MAARGSNKKQIRRLGEVFGYPVDNLGIDARYSRDQKRCPFRPRGGPCTKVNKDDPLGVCSMTTSGEPAILCPTRFLADGGTVVRDAAAFLFPDRDSWALIPEVELTDSRGQPVGNIDMVLLALDEQGDIADFGALEIQAVYTQGGQLQETFKRYLAKPEEYIGTLNVSMVPRADYLSSRKRLNQQMLVKGSVLTKAWGKKMVIAVDRGYFARQPVFSRVSEAEAEIAWLVYDLVYDDTAQRYRLTHAESAFTTYDLFQASVTTPPAGSLSEYQLFLAGKLAALRVMGRAITLEDQLALAAEILTAGVSIDSSQKAADDADEADD